jgi:hypothetical protein
MFLVSVERYTSKPVERLPATALHGRCFHVMHLLDQIRHRGSFHTYRYVGRIMMLMLITTARYPRLLTVSTLPIDMASKPLHRRLGKRAVRLIAQAVKRLTGACRLASYCR